MAFTSSKAFTGKNATVKQGGSALSVDVTAWSLDPKVVEHRFASDKTSGHKRAIACVADFDATITIKLPETGQMPFLPGDTAQLEFHGDDSGNNYIEADCIVLGDPIPTDINDGNPTEVQYALAPNGVAVFHGIYWSGAGSSGTI